MSNLRRLLIANAQQTPQPTVREFKFTVQTTSNNYTYSFTQKNSITDYNVDWGDGTVEVGTRSHKYVTAGTYQIRVYETDTTTTFPFIYLGHEGSANTTEISVDTPYPYLDGVTSFEKAFKNCQGIVTVPYNLFVNNPQITSMREAFSQCRGIVDIPDLFMSFVPNCYDFYQAFYAMRSLKISENIFCNNATEKTTRFANMNTQVIFTDCFKRISPNTSANGGTAPDLWDYTFGSGVSSGGCFGNGGNNTTTITNFNSIPSGWK